MSKLSEMSENTEITTFRVVELWTCSDCDFRAFPYEVHFYPILSDWPKLTFFVSPSGHSGVINGAITGVFRFCQ